MSDLAKRDPEEQRALDAMERMESALDFDFEGWNPEPGDRVTGVVIYVDSEAGQNNELGTYPLVAIVQKDGTPIALHCFHEVLRQAVKRWNPQPGDIIGVRYKGRTDKGGFQDAGYEDYNVIVQHTS
jgi:hypothetical protein